MGIDAVKSVLKYTECDKLKNTILMQKEVMEDFFNKAREGLSPDEYEQSLSSKMQKQMLKAGVFMGAVLNRNNAHIASMLIDGYQLGVNSVQKCVNELTADGVEVPELAKDVVRAYDKNIKALRAYL
jgi:hypothetical protein